MVENIDFEELCLHFSNRANPKQQLEASNQLYSMLWSKETDLQAGLSILPIFEKFGFVTTSRILMEHRVKLSGLEP